ncbi:MULTISPECIES: RNase adapter RapZ [Corynebacterium]|uniref:RNase adapter RapZ n=2 Tax=Corynebacterium TaxID=1716 RepID=A0ABD4TLL7_9CORY|nr:MULTISPECIES: RNase adapter RapZ [Corynebacterium]MCO6393659.1 RNase adapter RapZ [Corynebacterium lipophilum]MCQ4607853.1 RNase adapter RapZ [Corynebacterium pseudogenitalium]MCQ4609145.1 RNase adapter RapZ [Corynebacterium sp. CCUG 61414]MCQ4611240.1 RNase adapter RapZ [Corynebacterium sp. CCUG 51687]MCQ4613242.1 RNase adapter RapZ [Corynebacterium pseudogenitalium]
MTSPLLPASESRRPVIITGLSGGGLSTAAKVFEDKGYFVSQNLPPQLILDLVEMSTADDSPVDHLAVVTDVRARMFNGSLMETIEAIEAKGLSPFILFLDARDEVLIRRFDSVRRTHPLQGNDTLKEGIERERKEIAPVRERADLIIDTTHLSVHDLRRSIEASVGDLSAPKQHVTVESFGFKHGTPRDADLVLDVRFLPNPFWIPELREFRGIDAPVADYVLSQPGAKAFVDNFLTMLKDMLKGYRHEGKDFITVGIGCTGGHHRSVAISEEIVRRLRESDDVDVNVLHRDLERN